MQSDNADIHAYGTENDFDFVSKIKDNKDDVLCPRGAHIRKTNPRQGPGHNDESHRIMRRGIPYGPELSIKPGDPRGLLFVCYQSKLDQGFEFIQNFWVNNPTFPPVGGPQGAGLDPIIGQNKVADIVPMNIEPANPDSPNFGFSGINAFVTPRGGEYFFVPPMSALRDGGALVTLK